MGDQESGDGGGARTPPSPGGARTDRTPTQRFDEIPGQKGAETRFRMERFDVGAFHPLAPRIAVRDPSGPDFSPTVVNVSQSGVALRWPEGRVPPRLGDEVELTFGFDTLPLWDGPARVQRVEVDRVGLTFAGLLDLEAVFEVARVRGWRAPDDALTARAWHVEGYHECKALIGDFRLLLEDARGRLDQMERELAREAWQGPPSSPAVDALRQRVQAEVVAPMVELSDAINTAYVNAGPGAGRALQSYAHRHLHGPILTSPFMHRALAKPLRYPGDYLLMNYIYRDGFAGDSLFARTMTAFGVSNRTGDAVRGRKDMIREELRALVERRAGSVEPVRILAVAAGPAEEAWELLTETAAFRCPIEIVLFEQDRAALTFAYRRLQAALANDRHPNVRLFFRNDSVTKLIYSGPDTEDLERYDAIFSCGLFDYFGDPAWGRVAKALVSCLAPGGTLWIGNMVPESPARWFMEIHLDWALRYRTEAHILELARRSAPELEVGIQREATGVNPFARIERP